MGFGVWGLGFGVWGLGWKVWGLGSGVWGLGFGVWGLGFGVWGLGFRFRVQGVEFTEKKGFGTIFAARSSYAITCSISGFTMTFAQRQTFDFAGIQTARTRRETAHSGM